MKQSPSREVSRPPVGQEICHLFIEPKCSLTCSQSPPLDPVLRQLNPLHPLIFQVPKKYFSVSVEQFPSLEANRRPPSLKNFVEHRLLCS
jgi:hypothetical protein